MPITEDVFTESLAEYVRLHDIITLRKKETKVLLGRKDVCGANVLDYLVENDIDQVDVDNGRVVVNNSRTKVPITLDLIQNLIGDNVNDQEQTKKIIREIEDRPKSQRTKLKRIKYA